MGLRSRTAAPAAGLLTAAILAGCGGSGSAPATHATAPAETTAVAPVDPAAFDYDTSAPLATEVLDETKSAGAVVTDLEFDANGRRVPAYLVAPPGKAAGPAVLFLHWLEYGSDDSNRTEFLEEAKALARAGVVSLLPDQSFPWAEKPTDPDADRERVVAQVVEHRRALDLLEAQPGVDAERIAVVGHDYGAMYGSLLARFDGRPSAYVLMTPDGDFPNWFLAYFVPDGSTEAYEQAFAGMNPVDAVADAAPASVFFQFGASDSLISTATADALFAAAAEPKRLERYEAGHNLDDLEDTALRDRRAWLEKELGLAGK